jgi:hypothetical protein
MYNACVWTIMFILAWTGWIVPVMVVMIYVVPVLCLVIAIADFTTPPPPRKKLVKE